VRSIVTSEREEFKSAAKQARGARFPLVHTGTQATFSRFMPGWISVSMVWLNEDRRCSCSAASRENARKPHTASGTRVPDSRRTIKLPIACNNFLVGESCARLHVCRSAIKAGILSGAFYIQAAALFVTAAVMALLPQVAHVIFGVVSAACFFLPGLKYHRQRIRANNRA
jgi:hypothetical protein